MNIFFLLVFLSVQAEMDENAREAQARVSSLWRNIEIYKYDSLSAMLYRLSVTDAEYFKWLDMVAYEKAEAEDYYSHESFLARNEVCAKELAAKKEAMDVWFASKETRRESANRQSLNRSRRKLTATKFIRYEHGGWNDRRGHRVRGLVTAAKNGLL